MTVSLATKMQPKLGDPDQRGGGRRKSGNLDLDWQQHLLLS